VEAFEFYIRNEVFKIAAGILEKYIEEIVKRVQSHDVLCCCGERMSDVGKRSKQIKTIFNQIKYTRSLYRCPKCGRYSFPADAALRFLDSSYSPGAQRLIAQTGSKESFRESAEDLRVLSNLRVDQKEVERITKKIGAEVEDWKQKELTDAQLRDAQGLPQVDEPETIETLYISFDGTGVPMSPVELKGKKGKQRDGTSKTREAKLGCVFTQTTFDEEGNPVRDPHTTSYVGNIENSQEFGDRIYREALRRGLRKAKRVICLTDGAKYNKTISAKYFPESTHIIDLYHSKEKIFYLGELIFGEKNKEVNCWIKYLEKGWIDKLIQRVKEHIQRRCKIRDECLRILNYFANNKDMMNYGKYIKEGLFVGSGVVEAGCKTVIGKRLKNSGMFWSTKGGNAIIALRCVKYSGRFEQFWESRVA
jgi:hypothetical protein